MNPFEILELAPGATPDEIKAAYYRLAKNWHPDRFSGTEKEAAENRFRSLAEAFNLLKDPIRRSEAEVRAARNVSGVEPGAQESGQKPLADRSADEWFKDAQEAFEAKDYSRALGLIQYTLRLDGNRADAYLLLAQLLGATGGDTRAMIRALENAIRINPKDVVSMIRLSETFQELGMQAKADRIRSEAFEIAPNHKLFRKVAASRNKQGPGTVAKGVGLGEQLSGLFGRIFKKG